MAAQLSQPPAEALEKWGERIPVWSYVVAVTRQVFTEDEADLFVTRGWVRVRDAFGHRLAEAGRQVLWRRMGLDPDDPSTWTEARVWLQEVFDDAPFVEVLRAERVVGAFNDVMGCDRWIPLNGLGWWPIRFPGGLPEPDDKQWHVDGGGYQHYLTSPEQGIVPLFLFSAVEPGGGATLLAEGSHFVVAAVLRDAPPTGYTTDEINQLVFERTPNFNLVEATGDTGDLIICHPFLIHRASANHGTSVRFMAQPRVSLKEPIDPDRDAATRSPVERAIHVALDADNA